MATFATSHHQTQAPVKKPGRRHVTLDSKHKEFVQQFGQDDQKTIPRLKEELQRLKQQLRQLVGKSGENGEKEKEKEEEDEEDTRPQQQLGDAEEEESANEEAEDGENSERTNTPTASSPDPQSPDVWARVMELEDRIHAVRARIRALKQRKINYYLDNAKYIFEFFEQKKTLDDRSAPAPPAPPSTKSQTLASLFQRKDQKQQQPQQTQTHGYSGSGSSSGGSSGGRGPTQDIHLVQRYLNNVDESLMDMRLYVQPTDICRHCHKGEMILLEDEGMFICNQCATQICCLTDNDKPNYKDPPKEVCFYAYKKINHFKEILAQFQGKETTHIPEHVIEQVRRQVQKERMQLSSLTYAMTKEILKKLGFNKYYEHIAFIKNKLGIKPHVFRPELEETLCNLWLEIQSPYARHCPDYRINFLNYYYVLYKFCELLSERQYLDDIPLLHREKLMEHDEIWKMICLELNWEFIPTV